MATCLSSGRSDSPTRGNWLRRRRDRLRRSARVADLFEHVSSAQFLLQARKQHYRIMKTQPISFLSGLIVAIAVPVILNAASLSWNPDHRYWALRLAATTNATPQEELGIPNYEFHDSMGKWRVTHRANWQSRLLDKSRTVRDATI